MQGAGLPMTNKVAQQSVVTCELRYDFNDKQVVIDKPYQFMGGLSTHSYKRPTAAIVSADTSIELNIATLMSHLVNACIPFLLLALIETYWQSTTFTVRGNHRRHPGGRCAISAVGRCGRWKEALALLEQMREDGIEVRKSRFDAQDVLTERGGSYSSVPACFMYLPVLELP